MERGARDSRGSLSSPPAALPPSPSPREPIQPSPNKGQYIILVRNIPKEMRVGDLREFFFDFVEAERFALFHFLEALDFPPSLGPSFPPFSLIFLSAFSCNICNLLDGVIRSSWFHRGAPRVSCFAEPFVESEALDDFSLL